MIFGFSGCSKDDDSSSIHIDKAQIQTNQNIPASIVGAYLFETDVVLDFLNAGYTEQPLPQGFINPTSAPLVRYFILNQQFIDSNSDTTIVFKEAFIGVFDSVSDLEAEINNVQNGGPVCYYTYTAPHAEIQDEICTELRVINAV